MRKVFYLLAIIFTLSACGVVDDTSERDVSKENEQQNEIETISQVEKDIVLIDNDDLTLNLKEVKHGRSDISDHVAIEIELTNKQNKTYELYLKDLIVDGKEINSTNIWIDEEDIQPKETIAVFINGYEHEELTANEHIKVSMLYKDYEGNRNEITFSEYIND